MSKSKLLLWSLMACCMVWIFIAPAVGGAEESKMVNEEYFIKKGDVLEVNVWKEEELTRTLTVRMDGKISLPLVDDIQAAGRTPMDLKAEIRDALSAYIEIPQVTVIVQEQSGEYFLIGEVASTGAFPLQKDLTIIQALALAEGFTEWADKDNIVVLRRQGDMEKRIRINYNDIVSGKKPEDNIIIQPGDTIVIN